MKRGYIKLWRKSKDSTIFAHEGLWKLWCLCLMKANHEGAEVMMSGLLKPVKVEPGQFITGRNSLWEDYHQFHLKKRKPRRKPAPSLITVYRWLLTLQEMQLLNIKTCNKYSIITIINWIQYQTDEQQMNNRRTTNEHKQELNKELKEETPDFFSLKNRYDQDLIDRVFQAIASTRTYGKVSESVLVAQLKKWNRYSVAQVEAGIRVYLEKDYAGQGKNEKYLFGIIKNQKTKSQAETPKLKRRQPTIEELISND